MLLYLACFASGVVTDLVWARYISAVSSRRPHPAALWATGTLLASAFNVISYTHEPLALLPMVAGGYLGTWWSVRRTRDQ